MDFIKEITSAEPVPAGGAAAAYSTNLALALIYKVLVVEMKRRIDQPDIQSNLSTLHREIERLLKDVERLVKQDSE